MGTPDFAVPALNSLINSERNNVKAVFTREPKPKGRGMKLQKSPIHELAEANNIDVHTPKTLKGEGPLDTINSIEADIIVVVAYGFIVPAKILEAKKYGCLNIHPSDLPRYRGAAPLQRTIINGDKKSAVCIMQMDEGMDTGDVLLKEVFDLEERMSLQNLHDKCAKMGGDMLLEVLGNIDSLEPKKQASSGVTHASKLRKEESVIEWSRGAQEIDCQIRGMLPWPGASFEHKGKMIKIIEAIPTENLHQYEAGTVMNDHFEIACGSGTLCLQIIKPEGKGKMNASDYLKGV